MTLHRPRIFTRCSFGSTLMFTPMALALMLTGPLQIFAQDEGQAVDGRDDARVIALQKEVGDLKGEIVGLNERVATLERLLLTQIIETSPENTRHLQLAVEVAEDQLAHSENLLQKGYVSEYQVQADRFTLERAKLRLELASMAADTAEVSATIQLFEAQAKLDLAMQRLEYSQRLVSRGYVTQSQVRADELDVERARAQVELIKAELTRTKPESDEETSKPPATEDDSSDDNATRDQS